MHARTYLYYIEPNSRLSVAEAEARIVNHDDACIEQPLGPGLSTQLRKEGVIFLRVTPEEDYVIEFRMHAQSLGVAVHVVTVPGPPKE